MPFFLQKSFLAILMLISRRLVERRGIGEKKKRFFRYSPAVTKEFSRVRWAISAWITGNVVCLIGSSELYATQLRRHYLKSVQLCSTIYGATEGLIGVNFWPLEDTPCYLLVARSMFFEFVPIENSYEEQPKVRLISLLFKFRISTIFCFVTFRGFTIHVHISPLHVCLFLTQMLIYWGKIRAGSPFIFMIGTIDGCQDLEG